MDYKVNLLEEALTTYEKENELFDRKKFDDVQVLSVVFKAMDLVKNLAIHDVVSSFCPCGKVTSTKDCKCPDTDFLDNDLH